MTEAEWDACTDTYAILERLGHQVSERAFRLFGSACCRRIWRLLDNDRTRRVVEVAEHVADGQASADSLGAVWYEAYHNLLSDEDADAAYNLGWGSVISNRIVFGKSPHANFGLWFYAVGLAVTAADAVARSKGGISCLEELPVERRDAQGASRVDLYKEAYRRESALQVQILRCIFGSRLRAAALNLSWRTPDVIVLAQSIYDGRAFDRLPVLADALEDAGCDDAHILAHCRSGGEHVRGCWVVDLLLGKS